MLRQGNIFTSICHSVHRMDWGRHPLPRQTGGMYPSIHWGRHPQETPFWQTTPLWADTPWQTPPGRYLPGRHPLADTPLSRHPQADTPGQTPPRQHLPWRSLPHCTGMLSCFEFHWCFFYEHLIYLFQDFCTPELWIKFRPFEKVNMITRTCSYLTQISKCLPQFRSK